MNEKSISFGFSSLNDRSIYMPNIRLMKEMGYEVDVATNFLKGSTCSDEKIAALKQMLLEMNVKCFQIDFSRNVLNIGENIKTDC